MLLDTFSFVLPSEHQVMNENRFIIIHRSVSNTLSHVELTR